MANKTSKSNVESLVFDDKNFNKHTEYGMHLLEESLRRFGFGRSILIDKNNRIIAGNGIAETATQIDMNNLIVVETDGNSLVAVKRTDIDLDSPKGREMALADNATADANLCFDTDIIMQEAEKFDFNPEDWGVSMPEEPETEEPETEEPEGGKKEISSRLIVECGDVTKLSQLFSELQDRGFECTLKE